MLLRNPFTALLLALLIWSGATSGVQPYTLGAGDLVRITVYEHPDLSIVVRISGAGNISFPLLGEVTIAGMTERQAELELANLLEREKIVRSPQVSVLVEDYQSQRISVLGNVAKPGVYTMSPGSTLTDMIAEAGGLANEAGDVAIVTRGNGATSETQQVDLAALLNRGGASQDIPVVAGDRIFVPRMRVFYIYGQVNRPNFYRLERNMTVMQALSVAGGLTDKGTERGLTIVRGGRNGETFRADLTQTVQPNDVIYVKESLF